MCWCLILWRWWNKLYHYIFRMCCCSRTGRVETPVAVRLGLSKCECISKIARYGGGKIYWYDSERLASKCGARGGCLYTNCWLPNNCGLASSKVHLIHHAHSGRLVEHDGVIWPTALLGDNELRGIKMTAMWCGSTRAPQRRHKYVRSEWWLDGWGVTGLTTI